MVLRSSTRKLSSFSIRLFLPELTAPTRELWNVVLRGSNENKHHNRLLMTMYPFTFNMYILKCRWNKFTYWLYSSVAPPGSDCPKPDTDNVILTEKTEFFLIIFIFLLRIRRRYSSPCWYALIISLNLFYRVDWYNQYINLIVWGKQMHSEFFMLSNSYRRNINC